MPSDPETSSSHVTRGNNVSKKASREKKTLLVARHVFNILISIAGADRQKPKWGGVAGF